MAVPKSPIRQLSWDHYLGKVEPREEYLRRRRLLVDAVINGDPVPSFDSPDQTSLNFGNDGDLTATPLTASLKPSAQSDKEGNASQAEAPTSSRRRLLTVVAACVIIAGLGITFLYPSRVDVNGDTAAEKTASEAVIRTTPALSPRLEKSLKALQENGWDNQLADIFLTEWSQQSAEIKDRLQEMPAISAVTELVASRATELMTMSSAGVTIDASERDQIEALTATLSLPPIVWPDPPEKLAVIDAIQTEQLLAVTPDNFTPSSQSNTAGAPVANTDKQPLATPPEVKNIDAASANNRSNANDRTDSAAADIRTPPPSPSGEADDEKPAAVTPPTPAPNTAKKERPASIVLSERNGCSAELINYRARTCRDYLSSRVRAPKMAVIPAGTFKMGDARYPSESPVVEVTIPSVLAFSTHEISFQDFLLYCKNSGADCPTHSGNDRQLPVVGVSWQEAVDYAAWLSSRTGNHYRLPSEAEWEYAARAGTSSPYPFGDTLMVTQARFSTPNREAISPLANSYQAINPNDYHLYHMVGNVREWVADRWQDHHDSAISNGTARTGPGQRVVRGGSYADNAEQLRSSARQPLDENTRDRFTGFRVVLDFSAKSP